MAIAFDDLFERLGRVGKLVLVVNAHQAALPAALESLYATYDGSDLRDVIAGAVALKTPVVADAGRWLPVLRQAAQLTVLRMVAADAPETAGTLAEALAELARQMRAGSESVETNVPGVSVAAVGTPTGDGFPVASVVRADGLAAELVIPEAARLTVTADSYGGGATAGEEPWRFLGDQVVTTSTLSDGWPDGSAADATGTAVSPASDANVLTNSDFETFTVANTPDDWTIAVGAAGTQVFSESSTVYSGTKCLRIAGHAVNTSLTQTIAAGDVDALTQYAVNLWVRVSGVPAAGVLTVDLIDGSGTVVADAAGTNNTLAVDLTALAAATWTRVSVCFRLPRSIPSTLKFRLRLSTALSVGTNLYIDRLAAAEVAYPYSGGPGVAVFSGATPFASGDGYGVTTTNDYGGSSGGATFQLLSDRLFAEMRASGLQLPSSGSPTQADTLITS